MSGPGLWLVDGLVIAGLLVLTAAVVGMVRLPDFGVRIHAAAKAAFLGLVPLLLAAALAGGAVMSARAVLIFVFLVLTTPVAAHALARAAHPRARSTAKSTKHGD